MKTKCGRLHAEKERIAVKIPNVTAERIKLTKKLNLLEKEMKRTVPKLNQYMRKADEACRHEQVCVEIFLTHIIFRSPCLTALPSS